MTVVDDLKVEHLLPGLSFIFLALFRSLFFFFFFNKPIVHSLFLSFLFGFVFIHSISISSSKFFLSILHKSLFFFYFDLSFYKIASH